MQPKKGLLISGISNVEDAGSGLRLGLGLGLCVRNLETPARILQSSGGHLICTLKAAPGHQAIKLICRKAERAGDVVDVGGITRLNKSTG